MLQDKAGEGSRTLNSQLGRRTPYPVTNDNTQTSETDIPAPSNTPGSKPQFETLDADLRRLIDAWPNLPKHIKVAITALVEIHSKETN